MSKRAKHPANASLPRESQRVVDGKTRAHAGEHLMRPYFAFFFLSGFCSLVYEVVWLRLAMAKFGVTTPLISIVLSLFMAGLAIGSWGAGRLFLSRADRPPSYFLRLYAVAELVIGVSAFAVPRELEWGRQLLASGSGGVWGSSSYYLASGALVAAAMLPFCICMGATFPLALSSLRGAIQESGGRSFSYLYLANVIGACAGTVASAFVLIELLGFRRTLLLTSVLNLLVAVWAFAWSTSSSPSMIRPAARSVNRDRTKPVAGSSPARPMTTSRDREDVRAGQDSTALALLFLTGLASLAMELVWIRQFTPYLGPLVYSFAAILAVYLAFNALGSRLYRAWARSGERKPDPYATLIAAGAFSLLPLLAADPRLPLAGGRLASGVRLVMGAGPLCAAMGFVTPLLVDRWSGGDPDRAGRAYAANVVGCILGPLLAGFGLLPGLGERWTLLSLGLTLLAAGIAGALRAAGAPGRRREPAPGRGRRLALLGVGAVLACGVLVAATKDYESLYPGSEVRRDHTATAIAAGEGMRKQLLINGYGITALTPITKMMAHLPAAFRREPPRKSLVICFGMGTSFRSLLSWGAPTTAVELVPSVPSLFGYFHSDGVELLGSPLAEVVIDDGRRFLERTRAQYDVITIDPPPPVEAAASSLLYSKDFYAVVKKRLAPDGIVQQWLPWGEPIVLSAVGKALDESFAHVRVFRSVAGWGLHFLASASPIPSVPASALAARLPKAAAADLVEWGPFRSAERQFQTVLEREVPLARVIATDPDSPTLEDDRPVNEYYVIRRWLSPPPGRSRSR